MSAETLLTSSESVGLAYATAVLTLGMHQTQTCPSCQPDGRGCLAVAWATEVYVRDQAVAFVLGTDLPVIRAGHVSAALGRLS